MLNEIEQINKMKSDFNSMERDARSGTDESKKKLKEELLLFEERMYIPFDLVKNIW